MNRLTAFVLLLIVVVLLAACAPAAAPSMPASATEAPAAEAPSKTEPTELAAPAAPVSEEGSRPAPTQAPAQPEIPKEEPSTAAQPTSADVSQPLATAPALPTPAPTQAETGASGVPTLSPLPSFPSPTPSAPGAAPTPSPEAHIVQLEWPPTLRLGESDVVRLALAPSSQGYTLVAEYPEHQTVTQTVTVQRPGGYELFAIARLDGVGFEIAPAGDQVQYLAPDQRLEWRWSLAAAQPGRQRLTASLKLRWVPTTANGAPIREVNAYFQSLEVQVLSLLGLTRNQAMLAGLAGILLGGVLGVFTLVARPRTTPTSAGLRSLAPNPALTIELSSGLRLSETERGLLQAIFQRYSRLVIEREFLSGYSGARAFLALPIRQDGRADAYTIAKLGQSGSIQREFENYETFVKDTLPPITARIQHPPVVSSQDKGSRLAALQYTFIGEPGKPPASLRQALLENPDPAMLEKLLETFGPNWWLQRRPYTFRLAQEYDRFLPTHLVVEPATGRATILDGRSQPGELNLHAGDLVALHHFSGVEVRNDGQSLSLHGAASPGHPPLRVRWLSLQRPEGAVGRIVATRQDLLTGLIAGCDLLGLPDPLLHLPELLTETISGSQSTIHGDLNLENILVGPGGMLWLIDFAQTRDGHTLFDFAHLKAELIAHVLAPQTNTPRAFLEILQEAASPAPGPAATLLATVDRMASRCLQNPSRPDEYQRAGVLACLGALKYANLHQKAYGCLYLAAAYLFQGL